MFALIISSQLNNTCITFDLAMFKVQIMQWRNKWYVHASCVIQVQHNFFFFFGHVKNFYESLNPHEKLQFETTQLLLT